jgi:P2 family phage contractile tail tube protein
VPVVVMLRGRVKESDMGTWKPGEAAKLKITLAVNYYKYTQAGTDLVEIDVEGMKRVINGVDQLAQTRTNLGIG